MKTAKLTLGIISIVLSFIVLFQSCAAGALSTLTESGEVGGSAGFFLAICMIAAGIVGIVARRAKGGAIASAVLYILGGIVGIVAAGSFGDLIVWSVIAFIFAAVFIISLFTQKEWGK